MARTFKTMLMQDLLHAQSMLLAALEEYDRLRYVEGPRIEQEYMDKVGAYEQQVIEQEMECELLQEKQRMVQSAVNRRESIDEAAIDEQIERMRQQMHKDAQGEDRPELPLLDREQKDELQEIYHEIVKNYHPQSNANLSQAQRELYQRALEAYRRNDLEAMRLVKKMLDSTKDGIELSFDVQVSFEEVKNGEPKEYKINTDYSLAEEIFKCFAATGDEKALMLEKERYTLELEKQMKHIEQLQEGFPFIASEMLGDPQETAAYMEDLKQRMNAAQQQQKQLHMQTDHLLRSVQRNG